MTGGIFINVNYSLERLNFRDIEYVQAMADYCQIYTRDKRRLTIHKTLKGFGEFLPHYFYRCHRSFIINTKLVSRIPKGRDHVVIDGHPVPIGEQYLAELLNKLLVC